MDKSWLLHILNNLLEFQPPHVLKKLNAIAIELVFKPFQWYWLWQRKWKPIHVGQFIIDWFIRKCFNCIVDLLMAFRYLVNDGKKYQEYSNTLINIRFAQLALNGKTMHNI